MVWLVGLKNLWFCFFPVFFKLKVIVLSVAVGAPATLEILSSIMSGVGRGLFIYLISFPSNTCEC